MHGMSNTHDIANFAKEPNPGQIIVSNNRQVLKQMSAVIQSTLFHKNMGISNMSC